jgi:signal transduction histidine kinase
MNTTPATVLIVDDLPANRLVIERHLERMGCQTLSAEDGRQALDLLAAHEVDLVMLDLMMPVMNGFETLAAMRADPTLAHVPVVVVSALHEVDSVARCIELGAEDFLSKPVERALLEARVRSCLARKHLHDRERAACASAREANLAKGRFVALVSHELRSPLTAIISYADLLLDQQGAAFGDQQRDHLQAVRRLGRQMAALIEDLSDLSQIESGHLQLIIEPVSLADVISEGVSATRGLLEARGHRLRVALEPGLPLVRADAVRLTQALTNLLSNACKYTPDGGSILVTAHTATATTAEVRVHDNGSGIPLEEQGRVFEPFFRARDVHTRLQPGTGLGLSITRQVIEQHGGRISFVSAPGEGTTFAFTVPLADVAAEFGAPQPSASARR